MKKYFRLLSLIIAAIIILSLYFQPCQKSVLGKVDSVEIHIEDCGNHQKENIEKAIKKLIYDFKNGYNDCSLVDIYYNATEVMDLEHEYQKEHKGEVIILKYIFLSGDSPPVGITPNSKTSWIYVLKKEDKNFEIISYGF